MNVFHWSDQFLTGFDSIDAQHRYLFELINRIGVSLDAQGTSNNRQVDETFRELAAYAATHFKEEERLMHSAGVPAAYFEHHATIHREFVAQVKMMWSQRSIMSAPAETIHGFLAAWLSSHILGEDQKMAQCIRQAAGEPEPDTQHQFGNAASLVLQQALAVLTHELSRLNSDLVATNRDLETKVAERSRELIQSEKMASIGQLAAGVAHEINNPIGFVNSNLGTLERYANQLLELARLGAETEKGKALCKEVDINFLSSDLPSLIEESKEGLDRVCRIVTNLKDFARPDESGWKQTDLLAGLDNTVNVAVHELRHKAEIVRKLSPLPEVWCIPAQINQVFLNLLVNAAQAIEHRGTITLTSGTKDEWVWVEIADTGCGMDEATRQHIFEPFFTTKAVGTGTGLGMTVSYDIIQKHNGRFEVHSVPGKGTRIRVWLPTRKAPG